MRPLCFVVCFTLGVTLMVFSGYVPRRASAREAAAVSVVDEPGSRRGWPPRLHVASSELTRHQQPDSGETLDYESDDPLTTEGEMNSESSSWPEDDPGDVDSEPIPDWGGSPENVASELPSPADDEPPEPAQPAEPSLDDGDVVFVPTPPASGDDQRGAPPPVANAGPDRIVWAGWNELTLDAAGSTGEDLVYTWTQVAGPTTLKLRSDGSFATATGLPGGARSGWSPALYRFAVMVQDAQGRQATDEVEIVVLAAPELTITPAAQRRFELRDGYWLGHFQSWVTALGAAEASFQVESPTRLSFTQIQGGRYRVRGGDADGRFAYEVVLARDGGEMATFVELLVDTDEKTPGVLQLGAFWAESE